MTKSPNIENIKESQHQQTRCAAPRRAAGGAATGVASCSMFRDFDLF
jgi:hypothetical protein